MAPSSTKVVPEEEEVWGDNTRSGLKGAPKVKLPNLLSMQRTPFEDKFEERNYLKHRLALAFRIFAKYGFNEGIAGHITLRVRSSQRRQSH
jgi:hypothetical protein